jgi:hypothetical protein
MSARQPFFSARPASEQGTAQGFQKTFSIDSSNPLHLSSPAANQSESMKTAFSVPGPFSSNGAPSAPQVKTSGLGSASKRKSAHILTQSAERDRKDSLLNPVGFSASFSNNRMSRFPSSLMGFVMLRGYTAFSDRITEHDAHISTTETKQGASRIKIDDVGTSTKGSAFKQAGPQRVPLEQQFGQYNTSDMDLIAPMAGHEITTDGRVKMSTFGQTKKRNRDEIEGDEDESYWAEKQAKRHKSRHREEFETVSPVYFSSLTSPDDFSDIQRGYTKSPPLSLRPEKTSSLHAEGDVLRRFPDARENPGSPRYSGRRTTSPVNERHIPDESPQLEQVAPDERRNAFERLLGRDTNAFVQQNMEKYDALVKKWSECSEEEWIAGAEGFFLSIIQESFLLGSLTCYFQISF